MEVPNFIDWTSLSPFSELLDVVSHFIQILIEHSVRKQLEIQIRLRIMWRLIWACPVCLCPIKKTLGLYGLIG